MCVCNGSVVPGLDPAKAQYYLTHNEKIYIYEMHYWEELCSTLPERVRKKRYSERESGAQIFTVLRDLPVISERG